MTATVRYERRLNTGEYSHKLFEITMEGEDVAALARQAYTAVEAVLKGHPVIIPEPPAIPAGTEGVVARTDGVSNAPPDATTLPAAGFEWTEDNVRTFLMAAVGRLNGAHADRAPTMVADIIREFCPDLPSPRASLIAEDKRSAFVEKINALR